MADRTAATSIASPVSRALDTATPASWAPAVGLRLDAGSISLDRITVRTR